MFYLYAKFINLINYFLTAHQQIPLSYNNTIFFLRQPLTKKKYYSENSSYRLNIHYSL